MEVAPFFVDFHHFLSIFTIFYRFSQFTHFCRDLHFVVIYALFPQIFFGQNSLLRHITRFLHVWEGGVKRVELAKQAQTNVTNPVFIHNMPKEVRLCSAVISA